MSAAPAKRSRTGPTTRAAVLTENEKLKAENEKLKEENENLLLQTTILTVTTQSLNGQLDEQKDPFVYVVITTDGVKNVLTNLESAKFLLREHVHLHFRRERTRATCLRNIDRIKQTDLGLTLHPDVGDYELNLIYQKIPYFVAADHKCPCACGMCSYSFKEERSYCFKCRIPLCKGQRIGTVCHKCRCHAERVGMESIFNKGKDDDGLWIDPGNDVSLPTCQICGMLRGEFMCDAFSLAIGRACVRTGKTVAQWEEERNAKV